MAGIARWCFRHRYIVLALWLVAVATLAVTTRAWGTAYESGLTLPGSESDQAQHLLSAAGLSGQAGGDTIVIHVRAGKVTDPAVRDRFTEVLDRVTEVDGVSSVRGPYTAGGKISTDGRTAIADIDFAKGNQALTADDLKPVVDTAAALRGDNVQVEFGGTAFQSLNGRPTSGSVGIGLIAAAVVLLLAFGSLLSAVIPLLSAVLALGAAIESIGLLTHALSINTLAPTIAALIGLGVGVDYALFIVTRHRNGLRAGLDVEESAVAALRTAGRAVLFAGGTVTVTMAGLALLGIGFLTGIGIAAAVMVVFAVLAAVTLLPAMFGIVGRRVLKRAERRGTALATEGGFWARWVGVVQRRPALLGATATLVMLALAVPAVSIRLGSADQGNDPATTTTRKAYDLVADAFGPGFNGPLVLAAETPATGDQAALDRLVITLRTLPGVASVAASAPTGSVTVVRVTPTTSPQSDATGALIDRLRDSIIPAAAKGSTLRVYVGGQTALFEDFGTVLADNLPLFIAVVVILGCLLLMLAFRSIVIPLTAAVMNLLAAGASFGVVVAVFQWGWGAETLGLGKPGPIESFLPVMLLAILFGLSMDYQVFLVSRMHEEWIASGDNPRAVRVGIAATGRVITAAAAIMVCVFLAFVLGGRRPIGEFGLGLATAILLDALLLRMVLVPAAMQILGGLNWRIPGWLDRALPRISIDAPTLTGRPAAETELAPSTP